jgi:XTP/dITP diphosphohydrolase
VSRIVFATENPAKLAEAEGFAAQYGVDIIGAAALGLSAEVDETGRTFAENARLKAQALLEQVDDPDLWVLGDDSGLSIAALNGEPGIHTRRWIPGPRMTEQEVVQHALHRMRGVPYWERTARMVSAVAVGRQGRKLEVFKGVVQGVILEGLPDTTAYAQASLRGLRIGHSIRQPRPGEFLLNTSPVGQIFYVPEEDASLAELEAQPRDGRTHRAKALTQAIMHILSEK